MARLNNIKTIWHNTFFIDKNLDAKFKQQLFLVIDSKGKIIFHNKDIKLTKHELFEMIDKLQDF